MRCRHAMSIFSFFVFFFLDPSRIFYHYYFLVLLSLMCFSLEHYFSPHIIPPIHGLSRISGVSRSIFWFKRRLWLAIIFDLTSGLRAMGAPRLARWL